MCIRALLNEYGTFTHFPPSIKATVLELEEVVVDQNNRKRFKFLSHLPLGSVCHLCEINLKDIISEIAIEPLLPKLQQREEFRVRKTIAEEKARVKAEIRQEKEFKEKHYKELNFAPIPAFVNPIIPEKIEDFPAPQWVPNATTRSLDTVKKNGVIANTPAVTIPFRTTVPASEEIGYDSDEEIRPPAYSASFVIEVTESKPLTQSQKKRKNQKQKKQLLFSTSTINRSYS